MAGQARATGKLTTEDENENADDLLLLRRNLQLTRARLSLQASALSEAEKTSLLALPADDRAFVVMTWIMRLLSLRLRQGGLAVPPPLLTRIYQSLTDAAAHSQQGTTLWS